MESRRIAVVGTGVAEPAAGWLLNRRHPERLAIVIRESECGLPLLVASQVGERRPLTDRNILACLGVDLFMTFKVFLGIHVEALRLWWNGVPLFTREPRPASADMGPTG